MIARVQPDYRPSERQKQVKKTLESVTGLGVKIVPFQPPVDGMPATVQYVLKCDYSKDAGKDTQAAEIHAFHDYIKNFVAIGGILYNGATVSLIGGVDGAKDSMYPWTSIRFCHGSGFPYDDDRTLETVKEMERKVITHISPTRLPLYQEQQKRCANSAFKDGFSSQLGG
jgi:hypothetical protein